MKVPQEVEEHSCLASQEIDTGACSLQAFTVASLDNIDSNTPEHEDSPEKITVLTNQNTSLTRYTNFMGAAPNATKS